MFYIFLWCVCVCLRVHACVGVGVRTLACAYARVALIIQYATRMLHIAIYGLSGSSVFFTLPHKWYDFR